MELGAQQKQFAYLQAKDLVDTIDGVMLAHDVALWNGSDTSLSTPTTLQYFGAAGRSPGGQHYDHRRHRVHHRRPEVDHRPDDRQHQLRGAAHRDLREPGSPRSHRSRDEVRVQTSSSTRRKSPLDSREELTTQAGELPLIPTGRWPTPARPARARGAAALHRHRRPDRVPLASVPTRASSSLARRVRWPRSMWS